MKRCLATAAVVTVAAPVAALSWALIEAESYVLRRVTAPVLPAGAAPVTILHLSDLHLRPGQRRKVEWVRRLAELEPDLVVTTGDLWSSDRSLAPLSEALSGLLQRPGAFVMGSNDYYAPRRINPLGYVMPSRKLTSTPESLPPKLPVENLRRLMTDAGWSDLNNARGTVNVGGLTVDLVGTDDAHIGRDEFPAPAGAGDADLKVGVTHSPYLRVLNDFAAEGADLVLAGHTHGGQICVPFYGALVTNCDLPRSQASGLHRWTRSTTAASSGSQRDVSSATTATPGDTDAKPSTDDSLWLHVSAGLGTAPSAPIRLACRPEATLLTLTPGE